MSIKNFTKKYVDILERKYPNDQFKILDDSTIESTFNENTIKIYADNAYKEYKTTPDSIEEILNRYSRTTEDFLQVKQTLNPKNIIPVIKPKKFLQNANSELEKLGNTQDTKLIYEEYNDELIIAYAIDNNNSISFLNDKQFKELSITLDSLKKMAIHNIDKLLTNVQRQGGDGTYMLTAGGNYEASLILLSDVMSKENLPVDGDLIIAIPNRDLLLITGNKDIDGIKKLKQMAKESFETGSYPVSEFLYKWNGNKFIKFQ